MFERNQVIYLQLKGHPKKEVAKLGFRADKMVSNFIKAYCKNGLDELERGQPTGAHRKLIDEQEQELIQVVAYKTSHNVGFENYYN